MKSELELQKDFIENPELLEQIKFLEKDGIKDGLNGFIYVEAFLKGIRDLGYKDTPYAFNELNDNSFQAGARNIHYDLIGVANKVREIVVYDDGHGMPKEMLPIAVAWGGTHRQGSRKGFGKYGYGLPSACMHVCKKYSIYSKIKGGKWNKIIFNIAPLYDEDDSDLTKILSPVEEGCTLPDHIKSFAGKNYLVEELEQGTIIQIEEVDRAKPITLNNLQDTLMSDFGITYFKLLETTNMFVNDRKVLPVDSCFATPGMKGYEEKNNNLKVDIDDPGYYGEKIVTLTTDDGEEHEMQIRWSRLPGLFAHINTSEKYPNDIEKAAIYKDISKSADQRSFRWKVMTKNHGIVFRRLGRRMDVAGSRALKSFMSVGNNSRYWNCEVNFPPVLDEHFEVNTSKQQILPSEKVLKTLAESGIFKTLNKIEVLYYEESKNRKRAQEDLGMEEIEAQKESEILAQETALISGQQTATPDHQERIEKANENKQKRIEQIAKKEGISIEQAGINYTARYSARPKVFTEEKGGRNRPFISFEEHGETVEVIINTEHTFFKTFYMCNGSSVGSRTAWQTFFLLYADLLFKYPEDQQDFIFTFMNAFSENLKIAGRKDYEKKEATGEFDEDPAPDFKENETINFDDL